ncbi:AIPR family protein [Mesorhizobium sp. M0058]|uniref:AIPR family protein n=1 Tax=Mesorhizobium sp. M0058 TaxID=2956865 RepID=UPI00333B8823
MPLLISVIARQTTGSIFRAWRKEDVDASRLQVPLKIIEILDDGDTGEIAPRVSQSANNQNEVDMADFSSNHRFHRRMQELSGRSGRARRAVCNVSHAGSTNVRAVATKASCAGV